MEAELQIRDGENHVYYAHLNKIDRINQVIVAYDNGLPVGCGAIREYEEGIMEVKRMFVPLNRRGEGIASEILRKLEQWAAELNIKKCLLETGKNQPEAIALYTKSKYKMVSNFGQYKNEENSVCFEKIISQ
jgi:GNAT superfamily N-acetyltransferase